MPTAVSTASSEKTASSTTICSTIAPKPAGMRGPDACVAFPSPRSWSSTVPFSRRNSPPMIRIRSRCENDSRPMENQGSVSFTNQEMTDSSARRMPSASDKPTTRARSRWSGGSLSTRMAMKIRLSMPSTISSRTSVNRPAQAEGSDIHSNSISLPRTRHALASCLQVTQHLREYLRRGGDDAARLHPLLFTFEVGYEPARFQYQQTARSDIPWLEPDAAIAVETPGRHIGQIEHRRAEPAHSGALSQHGGKGRLGVDYGLAQMRRQQGLVIAGLAADPDTPVVQERTAAAAGGEQLVAGRVVDHGLRDLAALLQGDGNRIQRQAMNEVGGAVDWIDDPLEFGCFTAGALGPRLTARFFAQQGVGGIGRAQHIDDGFLGGTVHFRDIILGPFACYLQAFEIETGPIDDIAGTAGRLDGGVKHRV